MGALLATGNREHELGAWYDQVLKYGDDVINVVDSFVGGGGGGSCAAERQQIEQDIRQYLNQQDMNRLTSGMQDRVAPNPQAMAFFIAGEGDCKHKNVGSRHQRFINETRALIQQRKAGQSSSSNLPSNMMLSGGGIPDWLKYTLIAGGVVGGGFAAYAGYQALTSKKR